MSQPLAAGLAVALVSLAAILGPALGLSPWWITLVVALGLGSLTLDAARFGGRGGHVLAEALPGGQLRLRRIAIHEAGHVLVARQEAMAVRQVLVGSLACLRAGLNTSGSTELEPPAHAKLPPEELRRWSRVLQAGMAALEKGFGAAPVFIREGGSIPIVGTFQNCLKSPVLLLGYGLSTDNIHSPNEKFHLVNYWRGIRTSAVLMAEAAR